jgi:hypothetical protein
LQVAGKLVALRVTVFIRMISSHDTNHSMACVRSVVPDSWEVGSARDLQARAAQHLSGRV